MCTSNTYMNNSMKHIMLGFSCEFVTLMLFFFFFFFTSFLLLMLIASIWLPEKYIAASSVTAFCFCFEALQAIHWYMTGVRKMKGKTVWGREGVGGLVWLVAPGVADVLVTTVLDSKMNIFLKA